MRDKLNSSRLFRNLKIVCVTGRALVHLPTSIGGLRCLSGLDSGGPSLVSVHTSKHHTVLGRKRPFLPFGRECNRASNVSIPYSQQRRGDASRSARRDCDISCLCSEIFKIQTSSHLDTHSGHSAVRATWKSGDQEPRLACRADLPGAGRVRGGAQCRLGSAGTPGLQLLESQVRGLKGPRSSSALGGRVPSEPRVPVPSYSGETSGRMRVQRAQSEAKA
jgi:hypothetical protein